MSLAHALRQKSKDCRIVYIGLKGESLAGELSERYKVFDEIYTVPSGKFRRYHGESLLAHLADVRTLALNIRDFFRVLSGIGYSLRLMARVKPDAVFSKGGFVAVPVGLAAAIKRVPIVTHDSDTVPGLANRIIGRFARIHATGMSADLYGYPSGSVRYVGIPLDERIKAVDADSQADYKRQLVLPKASTMLLVGGAGLGSKDINDKVLAIAPQLLGEFEDLRITHISGQKHQAAVQAGYESALSDAADRVKVVGFTPEFYKYTGAADVVITRAGATTIAELAAQKKAVILIPAPYLTGGHQLKNAEALAAVQAAEVIRNDAPPEELKALIEKLLKDKKRRARLAAALGSQAKIDAAGELAAILMAAAAAGENA